MQSTLTKPPVVCLMGEHIVITSWPRIETNATGRILKCAGHIEHLSMDQFYSLLFLQA